MSESQTQIWSRISPVIFRDIFFFLSNRWLQLIVNEKSWQEYPVNAGFSERSIFDPALFLPNINDLPDDVICNITIYDIVMEQWANC